MRTFQSEFECSLNRIAHLSLTNVVCKSLRRSRDDSGPYPGRPSDFHCVNQHIPLNLKRQTLQPCRQALALRVERRFYIKEGYRILAQNLSHGNGPLRWWGESIAF